MTADPTGEILVVGAGDLRATIGVDQLFGSVSQAFVDYSAGKTSIGAYVLPLAHGDVHVKSASSVDSQIFIVKVASWIEGGAPGHSGTSNGGILVSSARSGRPLAFLYDQHYLTDLRSAAAAAIATNLLAPQGSEVVGIIGTGTQAFLQPIALHKLRQYRLLLVWGRHKDRAERLATRLSETLGVTTLALESAERVVRESDIVLTATASCQPVVHGDWLREGHHITASGADDGTKRELDSRCLIRADRLFVDSRSQTLALAEFGVANRAGELAGAPDPAEIGEVLAGRAPGRGSDGEITLAKLTGIAALDLAAAEATLQRLAPTLLR